MKFFKAAVIAFALSMSTLTFAQGTEEICHDSVELDISIKHYLQSNADTAQGIVDALTDKNPKRLAYKRERIFWVDNRKDLPDDVFRKLSFLACIIRLQ